MIENIFLNDSRFFSLSIGRRVLKSQVFEISGDIPLYSANVFQPFGYTKKSNISDFDHDYLLWGIDGKFEFNVIKKGVRFAFTDHCGAVKILDSQVLPDYLKYQLELQSKMLGYDRTLRPSLKVMSQVVVQIPFKSKGTPDVEEQQKVVKKYKKAQNIKANLKMRLEELKSINIKFKLPDSYIKLKVSDIFDLNVQTNRSWFTQEYVNKHKGSIPVYSASQNQNTVNYGYVKDNLPKVQYFEDTLTWNLISSGGKAFFRTGKFTLSENVIPLVLQTKWKEKIDPLYVKYILEIKATEEGLSYYKAGKGRIKNIEIEVPTIKSKDRDEIDIKQQRDIVQKYEKVYKLRDGIVQALESLCEIEVNSGE